MHHLPRFFKRTEEMDPKRNRRKLERRNAAKHIDYDAAAAAAAASSYSSSSSSSFGNSSSSSLITRSLDLSDRTSFRIEGIDGEIDRICITLGLNGPDDFAIPEAAWEARKIRSSSDLLPRSRLNRLDSPESESDQTKEKEDKESFRIRDKNNNNGATELTRGESAESSHQCCSSINIDNASSSASSSCSSSSIGVGGGIKGARPPLIKPPPAMMLKPPPAMTLPAIDHTCSTWDLFRDFAPESERNSSHHHLKFSSSSSDEEEEEKRQEEEEEEEERDGDVAVDNRRDEEEEESLFVHLSESGSCSFTTNDDDWSSTTTEPMSNISPNSRFRRVINPSHWQKGVLLGRGSFGSVYEGISE